MELTGHAEIRIDDEDVKQWKESVEDGGDILGEFEDCEIPATISGLRVVIRIHSVDMG